MRQSKLLLLLSMACATGCNLNTTPSTTNTSVLTKGIALPPGTNAILAVKSTAGPSTAAAKALNASAQTNEGEGFTLELHTAVIVVEEIEFRLACTDSGEEGEEFELEGPFLVDLVQETVVNLGSSNIDDDADDDGEEDADDDDDDNDGVPDDEDDDDDGDGIPDEDDQTMDENQLFDAMELPEGTYHRIEYELEALEAEDAPNPEHEMIGLSVLVTGWFTLGEDMVLMEYCASFEEELEFRSADGIVVENGDVATFLLTIDPIGWFDGVDPAEGTLTVRTLPEDDVLVLVICGDSNPDLAEIVRNNIRNRARLGHDEDGDGHDDDDEDGDLEDDDGSDDHDECNDDSTPPSTCDAPDEGNDNSTSTTTCDAPDEGNGNSNSSEGNSNSNSSEGNSNSNSSTPGDPTVPPGE